ncbi:MAG: aminotransferase class III-fold pyridoxal phosphate-dependent enzyme [Myxococcales bacterium]|nr:aminotransferase class III-fold pyridoxal phosphate-dependent enzyme [Myxococcales bacterium]
MSALQQLQEIRTFAGNADTVGLEDEVVSRFMESDPRLRDVIGRALAAHRALRSEFGDALGGPEATLVTELQDAYVNFYPPENVNPYVPLAADGPWIVTSHGAVLHDNGGYGMLGLGHAPQAIIDAMNPPYVMANVMTPSFTHKRFSDRMRRELGQTRDGDCPFDRFVCVNSGSESVTVAMRIADHNTLVRTGPGGPNEGATPKYLSLQGSFHGRTDRPAQVSDSTLPAYRKNLASFQQRDNLLTCPPNDVDALRRIFADAEANGVFIEMMFVEPVMGEGNPGQGLSRAFYDAARELTLAHGSLLLVDSIQAGLRGTGYLSIVDYPGFQDCAPPDMETWSKALNAGQYPLSVLGLTQRAAALYARGVYGNTMTTNPRALEVACAVLDSLDDDLRHNVRERGRELVEGLQRLQTEFPGVVTQVQGTGLLVSAELDPEQIEVVGFEGIEIWCRQHGLGVIHGGKNALRFTPHFGITTEEVDLVVAVVRQAIRAMLGLPEAVGSAKEREHVYVDRSSA